MVDAFVRAIETSGFERRLPIVDSSFPHAPRAILPIGENLRQARVRFADGKISMQLEVGNSGGAAGCAAGLSSGLKAPHPSPLPASGEREKREG
jgi:hypothetical protein